MLTYQKILILLGFDSLRKLTNLQNGFALLQDWVVFMAVKKAALLGPVFLKCRLLMNLAMPDLKNPDGFIFGQGMQPRS